MKQEVIFQNASSFVLPEGIRQKLHGNVLLITGTHARVNSFFDLPGISLSALSIPNGLLTTDVVDKCRAGVNDSPDVVIATGGGRIIDAMKLMVHRAGWKHSLLMAFPTTAGSGSEATPFAVYYEDGNKRSLEDPALLPALVLLDPWLIRDLPKSQRAISGIDAFTQSIESLWNRNATSSSSTYAKSAAALIWKTLPGFVNEPGKTADRDMLWASYLAGAAIATTRTTGCHALSYYLTAHHDVPHGQAVAFFLPLFFYYNQEADLNEIYMLLGVQDAKEAFEKVRLFMQSCGLATRFHEYGIDVDVDALIASVNAERFANNPVPFDAVQLKQLIQSHLI